MYSQFMTLKNPLYQIVLIDDIGMYELLLNKLQHCNEQQQEIHRQFLLRYGMEDKNLISRKNK